MVCFLFCGHSRRRHEADAVIVRENVEKGRERLDIPPLPVTTRCNHF